MKPMVRVASFVLLPVLVFFEYAAWNGARSVLPMFLLDAGMSSAELGSRYAVLGGIGLAGVFVAGVGAIAVGPWAFLVAGTLLTAAGAVALAVLPPEAAMIGIAMLAFGQGLTRPALYGAAARAFRDEREHLRTSLFLLVWGGMNVAAGLSGFLLVDAVSGEPRTAFLIAGGLAAMAVVAAGGLGAAAWFGRPAEPEKLPVRGARIAASFGLVLVLAVPFTLVLSQQFDHVIALARDSDETGTYLAINPIAVSLLCGLGAAAFAGLHFGKLRFPVLLPAGVGLVVLGAGLTMLLAADAGAPPTGTIWASLIAMAIGEVLLGPLLLSRVTGDLPYRLETVVVAAWSFASFVPTLLLPLLTAGDEGPSTALGWLAAASAVLLGVVVAVVAFPLRRVFEEPDEADDAPKAF